MQKVTHHHNSNTLIASAAGVASVGAAIFGVPGAVLGLALGFGLGYWSELKETSKDINGNQGQTRPR